MNTLPIISLRNVSKKFHVPKRKDKTILSYLAHAFSESDHLHAEQNIDAISHVSFDVYKGEVLGIIGKNASGKTTLLRVIAGIMQPDSGDVDVRGSITSLINLSVGLQPRLTVRDNIHLACALLGMNRKETRQNFDSIIMFGELKQYIHMYPFQLSTGMNQRLSFSIAVHTTPEVLLLDEVFSAGDIYFQQKAAQKMKELIESDVTVVMVSHDLKKIVEMCDRVLWLESGVVRAYGPVKPIIQDYRNYSKMNAEKQKISI